jgi:hypothetical protein
MFAIDLPPGATLVVTLPNGVQTALVHKGGGRFLSKIPPLFVAGVEAGPTPAEPQVVQGLPIQWDGTSLPGDGPTYPVLFAFDAVMGMNAVQAAGDAGDTFAKAVLDEMAAAQRTWEARMALAAMGQPQVDAPVAANDSGPVEAAPVVH